jgi:hypothetical protein
MREARSGNPSLVFYERHCLQAMGCRVSCGANGSNCVFKERFVTLRFHDTFGAISGPDSVHQLVDFFYVQ